jgi:hypothetical protein
MGTNKENKDKYADRLDQSYLVRGTIIAKVIELETMLDDYIALYFIPGGHTNIKFREFGYHFLSNMGLGIKRGIIVQILDSHYYGWREEFSLFENHMLQVIEARNRMAHHWLSPLNLGDNIDGITLVKNKGIDKYDFVPFSQNTVDELMDKINYCKMMLLKLTFIHFEEGKSKTAVFSVDVDSVNRVSKKNKGV